MNTLFPGSRQPTPSNDAPVLTRSVLPSFEGGSIDRTNNNTPMSPEVRAEAERRKSLAQQAQFEALVRQLNDEEIGRASLSLEEQRLAGKAINLFDDRLPGDWLEHADSVSVQQTPEVAPREMPPLGSEAADIAILERAMPEGLYESIGQHSLACANKLRQYALRNPARVLANVREDPELAGALK